MAGNRALRQRGLTIAELLVIMAVAVALLAIAVPSGQDADLAAADARRLIADGLRTRSVARTLWKATKIDFDLANDRWRCATIDEDPILSPDSDANGWRTLSDGVHFQRVSGKAAQLVFLPNGRTAADGGILVQSNGFAWEVGASEVSGTITSSLVQKE